MEIVKFILYCVFFGYSFYLMDIGEPLEAIWFVLIGILTIIWAKN